MTTSCQKQAVFTMGNFLHFLSDPTEISSLSTEKMMRHIMQVSAGGNKE